MRGGGATGIYTQSKTDKKQKKKKATARRRTSVRISTSIRATRACNFLLLLLLIIIIIIIVIIISVVVVIIIMIILRRPSLLKSRPSLVSVCPDDNSCRRSYFTHEQRQIFPALLT
jgi:uncharacterized membrane protein